MMCEGVMLNMLEEWVEGERWSVACEMPSAPYYWTFFTQRHNDTTEIELNYSKSNRCALEPIRKIVLRLEGLDFEIRQGKFFVRSRCPTVKKFNAA